MPKMAAKPIHGKNPPLFSGSNGPNDCSETWHVASETPAIALENVLFEALRPGQHFSVI